MSSAYYNEIDEYAAQWLRNLIAAGHIAPGVVDTRSIEDVRPDELREFTQCHFFAGVGVWSLALRNAGWADNRPIWTGSCPCQPFSAAGKGAGFADERHLWPAFHHLIAECRPPVVLGEQVASAAVDAWIDLVHADLEAVGYAFGSVPFPSAGVGAPHIRDRNYWVAHANGQQHHGAGARGPRRRAQHPDGSATCGLANPDGGHASAERQQRGGEQRQQPEDGSTGGVGNSSSATSQRDAGSLLGAEAQVSGQGCANGSGLVGPEHAGASLDSELAGPTNGYWRDADWLGCTDGKWRPVEPGTFPLVDGASARVGRLRAYGNAINAEAARVFVEVVMECLP